MEPLLLGLAAPSIASAAGAVGRAVSAVAKPLTTPFALLLQEKTQPATASEPQAVELDDLRTRADALQQNLERHIFQAIADSGVRLDSPVLLRVSELDGTLEAEIASPQREILEAALASNPDLADDFRELAAVRNLLSAIEKHEEFAEAYSRDPRQAISAYGSLADDRFEAVLHISADEDKARLEFE